MDFCDIYLLKSVSNISIYIFFTDSTFDEDDQVYCVRCGRRFIAKGDPTKHIGTHTRQRAFNCVLCGEPFLYEYCGAQFSLKPNLNRHIKNIHCKENFIFLIY